MRRRVLIVEDERLLGEALCELISTDHDAELATTVAVALARLRTDPDIEVILCDVLLPDGSAADVYREYSAHWPGRERRIVFVTGGVEDPGLQQLLDSGRNRVLKKPFDLNVLPSLIEAVACAST
ncbi:MAG: response regulator [Kofleriaceae bacterium]|nr:response regulator [Kofleriaceae bacterium]